MRMIKFLLVWIRRIPIRFTITFGVLLLVYLAGLAAWVYHRNVTTLADLAISYFSIPATIESSKYFPLFKGGLEGILVLLLLGLGLLLAYNLSAVIYRGIRARPRIDVIGPALPEPKQGKRLEKFKRIGIILAGGGAKGAYQAGAMKAIHEFLEENDALERVRMIAGTSIGSWNAMFWLAGLVKPPTPGHPSLHEHWWRSIGISQIIEFDTYFPLWRNSFLRPAPWREMFRQIFVQSPPVRERLARHFVGPGAERPINFYLTRANVERAHLEFSTNRPDLPTLKRVKLGSQDRGVMELMLHPDRYEIIPGEDLSEALSRTERAVFASMDLPPLFPYMNIKVNYEEWFEDGGVVDNLPVRFGTEIEECDLLFILPLNASFTERVNQTSVTKRLFRVMDVRQGVMERTSLKMVYMYNELAALRKESDSRHTQRAPDAERDLADRALRREHKPVAVFAICPRAPLAIGTAEFWKAKEAGEAFDLMYGATRTQLAENFEKNSDPSWIRMPLIGPLGEPHYIDDF